MNNSFELGAYVKVNKNYVDEETGVDLINWQGKIIKVLKDGIMVVQWDATTILQLPEDYVVLCNEYGYDFCQYNVPVAALVLAGKRNEPNEIKAAKKTIEDKYLNVEVKYVNALDSKSRVYFRISLLLLLAFLSGFFLIEQIVSEYEFYTVLKIQYTIDYVLVLIYLAVLVFFLLFINGIRLAIRDLFLIKKLKEQGASVQVTVEDIIKTGAKAKSFYVIYSLNSIKFRRQVSMFKAMKLKKGDRLEAKYLYEDTRVSGLFWE